MLTCFLRTVILYLTIAVTLRLLGKRQIGQLQPAELSVTILVSEIAAVPMQDPGIPLLYGLLPLLTLFALELLLSALSARSLGLRRWLCGQPVPVIRRGQWQPEALEKLRIHPVELAEELRLKDVFDPRQVDWAVWETNGRLSVQLQPDTQPVTPAMLGLDVSQCPGECTLLIVRGRLLSRNLAACGRDRRWLDAQLRAQGLKSPAEAYFMMVDDQSGIFLVPFPGKQG